MIDRPRTLAKLKICKTSADGTTAVTCGNGAGDNQHKSAAGGERGAGIEHRGTERHDPASHRRRGWTPCDLLFLRRGHGSLKDDDLVMSATTLACFPQSHGSSASKRWRSSTVLPRVPPVLARLASQEGSHVVAEIRNVRAERFVVVGGGRGPAGLPFGR
jgi:hypothetical protein